MTTAQELADVIAAALEGDGENAHYAYGKRALDELVERLGDDHKGIELSVEESVALWQFLQREDCPAYWEDPAIASLAEKAKSFYKFGPWDSGTSDLASATTIAEQLAHDYRMGTTPDE